MPIKNNFDELEFIKQSQQTINKMSKCTKKAYACDSCGQEKEIETNHWGQIYNTDCSVCDTLTTWSVSEEIPEGAWIPTPWTETISITPLGQ